jgi:hypothetical protein
VVAYFFRRNRRVMQPYYEKLDNLSKQFSASLSGTSKFLSDVPCFTGQFNGCKFTLAYTRVEGAPPNRLQLKCYSNSKSKLKLFSHSGPSRVLFAKKVNIADPELDKYSIYSNSPDEANRYLNNSSRKQAIRALIEKGWSFPIMNRTSISVSADVNHSVDSETVRSSLEQLILLRV